jgi:hypothetical protein
MAVTAELTNLRGPLDEARMVVDSIRDRCGESQRLGDLPLDPSRREGADYEGLGGYHR